MVNEAVMVCLDNSESMRNGDYSPTRLDSMNDAVNFIASGKTQMSPDTVVGILTMAGKRIEVLVSPCQNVGRIMTSLQTEVKIGGKSNFLGALKTAELALKNRANKALRQRIIMFVGSPIEEDSKEFVKLGKLFKKNNIAVDIVNFGSENAGNQNAEVLEAFVQTVNSSDNSHLVNVPPGPHVLADLIISSPVMMEGGATVSSGVAAAPAAGGIDPNQDPELAMAMRMSIEEERQRQERAVREKGSAPASTAASTASTASTAAPVIPADALADADMEGLSEEEKQMLLQAIAMSVEMNQDNDVAMKDVSTPAPAAAPSSSSSSAPASTPAPAKAPEADIADALKDPDFLNSLLDSVPDLNKDDLAIDDILSKLTDDKDKDKKENGGK